jgi:hypothetical protein
MPWMCLERCGFNQSAIYDQLAALREQARSLPVPAVTAVSFEWGDLGPNGTFIFNGFTSVSGQVTDFGAAAVPMVTTVSLQYIRQLFNEETAENFASAIVFAALREPGKISCINFDFEPTDTSPTQNDAIGYAAFLRTARRVLWTKGNILVSVDVAEWSAIWNWTLINEALTEPMLLSSASSPLAALNRKKISLSAPPSMLTSETTSLTLAEGTPPGYLVTMSTYATGNALFTERLQEALRFISPSALIVGLDVWHSDPTVMNQTQVNFRFSQLAKAGVCRVGVWQVPVPSFWVAELRALGKRCL